MSETINFPGIVGEIPKDPRVQEAIDRLSGKDIEAVAADALIIQPPSLEKYGIKMRPQNLMQGVIISRIMAIGEVDEHYQPWIWLWSLCAPIATVYKAIEKARAEGVTSLMVEVHEWFNQSGLPQEVTKDIMDAVAQTFLTASKLAPKTEETGGVKKNATPGGSS